MFTGIWKENKGTVFRSVDRHRTLTLNPMTRTESAPGDQTTRPAIQGGAFQVEPANCYISDGDRRAPTSDIGAQRLPITLSDSNLTEELITELQDRLRGLGLERSKPASLARLAA
jgi:hypothetical protein